MDCSLPGFSVHGIFQAGVLEWDAIAFSTEASYTLIFHLYNEDNNNIYLAQKTEKEMAPHSSTLAWKIPRTEEPGGLQSVGSQRGGMAEVTEQAHTR